MKKYLPLALLLILGFLVRVLFAHLNQSGDLFIFQEWGQKFWEYGIKNYYFGSDNVWTHTPPNYPPLSTLMFGGLDWLFQHKYVLAQLHNLIRIPPAAFIIYFYKYGDVFLIKLPSILADLGVGLVIYRLVGDISGNKKKALIGAGLYLLNPISIFVSSVWGQTDGLVSFFGLLAFVLLYYKKVYLSIPLLFVSFYLKPTWATLIPFYLFALYIYRPKLKQIILGGLISLIIFLVTTAPFADRNPFAYAKYLTTERLWYGARGTVRASVSAFNFHSLFFKIDRDYPNVRLAGVKSDTWGLIFYIALNFITFKYFSKNKKLFGLISSIYIISMGSFLFLTNMLERYFYPALSSMIIMMVAAPGVTLELILANLILFANLIWAFYRRRFDEIDHPFTNNNFLLIRLLSLASLFIFLRVLKNLKAFVLQSKRG